MSDVILFAEIEPKPAHFVEALGAVEAILEKTRAEEGCLRFDFFTDVERQRLYLYEVWRDEAAFEFHHAQTYTRDVFHAYEGWLRRPPELKRMVPIG